MPSWYHVDTSPPLWSAVKQRGEPLGRLAAHAGAHALVDGERDRRAGVTEALGDDLHRHAVGEQQRGVGVAPAATPPPAPCALGPAGRRSGGRTAPDADGCRRARSARARSPDQLEGLQTAGRPDVGALRPRPSWEPGCLPDVGGQSVAGGAVGLDHLVLDAAPQRDGQAVGCCHGRTAAVSMPLVPDLPAPAEALRRPLRIPGGHLGLGFACRCMRPCVQPTITSARSQREPTRPCAARSLRP